MPDNLLLLYLQKEPPDFAYLIEGLCLLQIFPLEFAVQCGGQPMVFQDESELYLKAYELVG